MATESTISTTILSVGCSLIVSTITTFIGYSLSRKKNNAEIAKIKAETDKIIAETAKTSAETKILSDKVTDSITTAKSTLTYYDGINISPFDFLVEEGKDYDNNIKADIGQKATGTFKVEDDMIDINRTNTHGRFMITLKKYIINGIERDYIDMNSSLEQSRKIQISFQIKSLNNTKHTLDFVLREVDTYNWFGKQTFDIKDNKWTSLDAFLRVEPDKKFRLKIYDRSVAAAPSSIQIRNLKVIENF